MHLGFSEDQVSLSGAVAALLERRCGIGVLRRAWEGGAGGDLDALWAELAGLGVQGMLAPEEVGGAGMDRVTLALVLAEAGRAAVPLPLVETSAVGVPLIAAAGDPTGLLPGVVSGAFAVGFASGAGEAAAGVGRAGAFVLDGPAGAVLYGRDEVRLEPLASVDPTRDLARVHPAGSGVALGSEPGEAPMMAALGTAAELVGLGQALVSMTVAYVVERRQFGVPVGSFQAVKHRLADAHAGVVLAAPAVWAASWLVEKGSPERRRAVSMAKAMSSESAWAAARAALQCHGAMGYTDAYHLHMWLKRVWCLAGAHGSAARHRELLAGELGLVP